MRGIEPSDWQHAGVRPGDIGRLILLKQFFLPACSDGSASMDCSARAMSSARSMS